LRRVPAAAIPTAAGNGERYQRNAKAGNDEQPQRGRFLKPNLWGNLHERLLGAGSNAGVRRKGNLPCGAFSVNEYFSSCAILFFRVRILPMAKKPKKKHPLRRWRFENNFTLKTLAAKSGIAVSYLSEIETGKKLPSFQAVIAINKLTGVPMEEFAKYSPKT
jgi:DNA-binding XRE family transcriptional regulator